MRIVDYLKNIVKSKYLYNQKFNKQKGRYELYDLNSLDGTWVKVRNEIPLKIADGTEIKI